MTEFNVDMVVMKEAISLYSGCVTADILIIIHELRSYAPQAINRELDNIKIYYCTIIIKVTIFITPTLISSSSRMDSEKKWPSAEDSICQIARGSMVDECRECLHTIVSTGRGMLIEHLPCFRVTEDGPALPGFPFNNSYLNPRRVSYLAF